MIVRIKQRNFSNYYYDFLLVWSTYMSLIGALLLLFEHNLFF